MIKQNHTIMKTSFLIVITLLAIFSRTYGQDTSLIKIEFQTKSNVSIPLFKRVYMADVQTQGWVGSYYSYQFGKAYKNEYSFDAPKTAYLKKNESVVFVMKDPVAQNYDYLFEVDPWMGNQKWLLTPAGKDYHKSITELRIGMFAIPVSLTLLGVAILNQNYQQDLYNQNLASYNWDKQYRFPTGSLPQPPKTGSLYWISGITSCISIYVLTSGIILHHKNRPFAVRIE